MKRLFALGFLAILFSFTSCSKNSDGLTEPPGSGIYLYTSFDTSGTTVVEGKFTMILKDSNSIIGKWDFKRIGNPSSIGPQFGTGDLAGSFEQNKIWIELNPQFRDNNLRLSGTINNNKYSSTWQWISIVGITNYGTFEAIKVF